MLAKQEASKVARIDQEVEKLDAGALAYGKGSLEGWQSLAWLSFWDILVFFGVLLVGFAYLWKRGDLDWVRSTAAERAAETTQEESMGPTPEAGALVGAPQG